MQRGIQELQKERIVDVKTLKEDDVSRGSIGWGSGGGGGVQYYLALRYPAEGTRELKIQSFAMVFSIHRDAICWPHCRGRSAQIKHFTLSPRFYMGLQKGGLVRNADEIQGARGTWAPK